MGIPRFVPISAAARAFHFHHTTIYKLAKRGVLRRRFQRNRYYIHSGDLVRYAQGRMQMK